jgi:hypothetical protein
MLFKTGILLSETNNDPVRKAELDFINSWYH